MEMFFKIGISTIIIILGIINLKGNISTIHWYNRTKVSKKDEKSYGKLMGTGSIIIGIGILITTIIDLITKNDNSNLIMITTLSIGLIIMLYAQFKYNKGIF